VLATSLLQLREHVHRRAHHPKVDILRGARSFEAQLEYEPALERCGVSKHRDDACEEAIEDDELAFARPREFAVLAELQRKSGIVVSRMQLRKAVWGAEAVSLRTIDASMKRLRHKLGSARYAIEAVRGVGYRFRELERAKPSD